MPKKYHSSTPAAIVTNDLFLAASLSSVGCTLDRMEKNERRRVSFVFVGDRCRELHEAYRTGPMHLDMRVFRETLNKLRDRVGCMVTQYHPEEWYHANANRYPSASAATCMCYAYVCEWCGNPCVLPRSY